jgi:hypothetical protein
VCREACSTPWSRIPTFGGFGQYDWIVYAKMEEANKSRYGTDFSSQCQDERIIIGNV